MTEELEVRMREWAEMLIAAERRAARTGDGFQN
jgi:hypothetical protein